MDTEEGQELFKEPVNIEEKLSNDDNSQLCFMFNKMRAKWELCLDFRPYLAAEGAKPMV